MAALLATAIRFAAHCSRSKLCYTIGRTNCSFQILDKLSVRGVVAVAAEGVSRIHVGYDTLDTNSFVDLPAIFRLHSIAKVASTATVACCVPCGPCLFAIVDHAKFDWVSKQSTVHL